MNRPTSLHLLALLLLSGLLLTGCGLLLGDDPSLTDTRWELQAIEIETTGGEMTFKPDPDYTYWERLQWPVRSQRFSTFRGSRMH